MNEKQIRAIYDDKIIRVYQAYPEVIAKEAVAKGTFGQSFKMDRMTWIKPSFLWMMYRCGWATKEGQERVLAIDIKRLAFDYIVKNAVFQSTIRKRTVQWKRGNKEYKIRRYVVNGTLKEMYGGILSIIDPFSWDSEDSP